ncbi:phosphatidylinositol 3-kinase [Clavulina sp. PMI_390]|nr:phosphatidylinositol 3-kinase [Clavulina sp. PMI_390]
MPALVGTAAERLAPIWAALKQRNEETRKAAAVQFRDTIRAILTDPPYSTSAENIWKDAILPPLFQLVHSPNLHERYSGVIVIDILLEIDHEDSFETHTAKYFRFYNFVKSALHFSTDQDLTAAATKTLNKVLELGGNLGDAFLQPEVPRLLEGLRSDRDYNRYGAVTILKAFARHLSHQFAAFVDVVLEWIWTPLRDVRPYIREAGADLLASCFDVVGARQDLLAVSLNPVKILKESLSGLKSSQVDVIHGSLLAYRVILLHSSSAQYINESFLENAEAIWRLREHKDAQIRRAVISILPTLAVYDTQTFAEKFLDRTMTFLVPALRRAGVERALSFLAIGHIAQVVGSDMKPFLEPIMANVKEAFGQRGKKNAPEEETIFQCIGMLAAAVGSNLTKLLHDVLDLMFAYGLSEHLRTCLGHITVHIPPLLGAVQERLLDSISLVLVGQNYKPSGGPAGMRAENLFVSREVLSTQTPEMLTMALTTLGSFDFSGHVLSEFARQRALPYLEHDHSDVRQAAALTCCRLYARDPICHQASAHAIEVMSEVLDRLLVVGIADPDAYIRKIVLSNLEERFDRHLAQAENVRSLFIALNDEVFQNRVLAIEIIGRLSRHNPAYVMPPLRKALIQLLTELEYGGVTRSREESALLLDLVVAKVERLIRPYVIPILKVLLPKARDTNVSISSRILSCIGNLARVGGEDLTPHINDIMSIILDTLQDQSSAPRRDAAIKALGSVCSNTAYVIEPLKDHPILLGLLTRILRGEQNQQMRRETIKVMGILGALDPYSSQKNKTDEILNEPSRTASTTDASYALSTTGSSSDEYYQAVAINSLLTVLRDPSLQMSHHHAIEAIMAIFRTQGLKAVAFLPHIIPAFLHAIRNPTTRGIEGNLQQLATLIWIIRQHVRNYLDAIFDLITEVWAKHPNIDYHIVSLISSVAKTLNAEFKPYVHTVLPALLKLFDGEPTEKRQGVQTKVFHAIWAFGSNVEEYLQLVIPVITRTAERTDVSTSLRITAVQTIDGLARKVNFSDHASRIIHPLVRILGAGATGAVDGAPTTLGVNGAGMGGTPPELATAVVDTLCMLLIQLDADFTIFVPMINKALRKHTKLNHTKYDELVDLLLKGEHLPSEIKSGDPFNNHDHMPALEASKMAVNQQHLKQAWDISQVTTKEDWFEWIRRLAIELMKESPSHALRACVTLAEHHPPLARELFNAAFVSCWTELFEQYQEDLVRSIEGCLVAATVPSDVIHILLNLAEFLERDDKALPIDIRTLGDCSLNYHAFAKALHYKELEFWTESSPSIVESLIEINNKLQLHDAAFGTLTLARNQTDVIGHEEWYEKLGKWQDALDAYNHAIAKANEKGGKERVAVPPEFHIGRMRCLHALGEWDALSSSVSDRWPNSTSDEKRQIAPLAAAAAWSLNQWDAMDDYIAVMKTDSPDRAFYRAVLCVHRNQFPKAYQHINKARDLLDGELTALVGESYGRAYNVVVRVQMLSELEEIITYKQSADQPDRQATIRNTWQRRLEGCQSDVDVWQRILQVRSLVLNAIEDTTMWIKFANLCRKSDRKILAEKTLNSLLGKSGDEERQNIRAPPPVIYANLKYMWAKGEREQALTWLSTFSARLADDLGLDLDNPADRVHEVRNMPKMTSYIKLLARCYLKQGEWQSALHQEWTTDSVHDILGCYQMSTQLDPAWYKAWHTWALANFEVVSALETPTGPEDAHPELLVAHVKDAIGGFFRSISLSNKSSLQDVLRLLTLWFKFGAHDEVCHSIGDGFSAVAVDTWLEVVPQIIARIQTPSANVRRLINTLLIDIGKAHPQALIYPLTVASGSSSVSRQTAASGIMDRMREHSSTLVEQAMLVSHELIRVAILWHELWHEGLEEASRLYFTDKNPEGMIAVLAPLHDKLEAGPQTTRETSFAQVFGKTLGEARAACRRFLVYNDLNEMNRAWEIYYGVFKKVEKQLPMLTTLDLQYVSPELLNARNLELAVPGTYHSKRRIVLIASFAPTLAVITSKQRPRRLNLKGDDGKDYQYLLKGHEDLRQDERVMQLFGLINTLLAVDTDSFKRHLHIQRFPVIPLAPNAGLLGWIHDTDTLHILVKEYRDSRKILLNIEYRLMLQMAPDYEILTVMQKVEVFDHALDNTTGQDLYRVLWLKSTNSDAWLDRRSTYTRSLAVTSMVGYILGLGDRHPSNLMLDRVSGKVIHIDFGDCFEVAMHRDKFPEKVPFRLTRMLTHAMEVSGIHGSYRNTCEISMTVLRANKESLLAVLEAFVYDPLINWRLLQADDTRALNGQREVAVDGGVQSRYPTQGPNRKAKADEQQIFNEAVHEVQNKKAVSVYNRVQNKLTGRDFKEDEVLDVPAQVNKLLEQATSLENLCQCFHGWYEGFPYSSILYQFAYAPLDIGVHFGDWFFIFGFQCHLASFFPSLV